MELFPKSKVVGIFRGFQQGGLEFHADLVLPYRSDLQNRPMHGQFLLVQLENPEEGVLGRITAFSAEGKLSYGEGEEFSIRALLEEFEIPEDVREQYLRYRVNIRVLGVVRVINGKLVFAPSHRRLPHVGSKVAFLDDPVLQEIAGHNIEGAPIGHLAFGEYIYAGNDSDFKAEPWMQVLSPKVLVRFPISSLVSRRSFIFARAGFGKSNLNKLLFSELYRETPTVGKRGGRKAKVGTVLFDPDGEYFWPDDKGRPGLCDVPHLQDKLVVFTDREPPSSYYGAFVAGGIRLDIRRLKPADVIGIALDPERQEQQNVRKLKGLSQSKWGELVDVIYRKGNGADIEQIAKLLDLDSKQEVEAVAARSNMTTIVRMLHDPNSRTLDLLLLALKEGKLCVVDLSQMRGKQGLILSGLILRYIFDHNQQEFTKRDPATIPTIAVIEEAQSVLGGEGAAFDPYVEWVKEGRKYDLGAVLITQQPGSIPVEILSQGDNWFVFHLLSQADLVALKRANAHFSDDLLSSLLNEPIPGQGVFWSSVGGKPYPLSIRVLSFEERYSSQDPEYNKESISTFVEWLRGHLESAPINVEIHPESEEEGHSQEADYLNQAIRKLAEELRREQEFKEKLQLGVQYGKLQGWVAERVPKYLGPIENPHDWAHHNLPRILGEAFGKEGWEAYRGPNTKGDKEIMWIRLKEET
ncbi:MAG: ATP-binding protein [Candidatus Bipolaricaulaceae bacterium]